MPSSRSAACFFIVAVTMAAIAAGKSTTTTDCTTLGMVMADCLSFVTNTTVVKPEGNCCAGLKKVLKTSPNCLCEMFKNSAQLGITVNVTKAVTLPAACKVHAPSVDKCGISLSPVAAPAPAPTPSSGGGMIGPPAAAPANKGSPSTTRFSIGFVLALIAGAIVATSF